MPHETTRAEDAVLAVLGGVAIEAAARSAGTSPDRLAEAIERYRAGGRAALDAQPAGWHQVNIRFADYPSAQRAFRAYLLPALRNGPVGTWWFVRKYPCWRLRVYPGPDATAESVIAHIAEALDASVSWGVVTDWRPAPYEPETVAFGGLAGMTLAHGVFHTDSVGILDYLRLDTDNSDGLLDAKAISLLAMTLMMRAAGLEFGEQGDVWGRVEERRPLADGVSPDQVSRMVDPMQRLLLIDARPLLAEGPLRPVRGWIEGLESCGRALKSAAAEGSLSLGPRAILTRHVFFHWNRMGFTTRQQSIWSRAAREAILGR